VTGVAEHEDTFRAQLATLLELDIVGDLRGTGYMWALELVKDKDARTRLGKSESESTRAGFSASESETLLRGFLSPELFERGLICRADDRGDPVVQISPPLVARQEEFSQIVGILGDVLTEAWKRIS
jgi:adenosylmethionine-8-amino-7-oxononanoate aminotransferase